MPAIKQRYYKTKKIEIKLKKYTKRRKKTKNNIHKF